MLSSEANQLVCTEEDSGMTRFGFVFQVNCGHEKPDVFCEKFPLVLATIDKHETTLECVRTQGRFCW